MLVYHQTGLRIRKYLLLCSDSIWKINERYKMQCKLLGVPSTLAMIVEIKAVEVDSGKKFVSS